MQWLSLPIFGSPKTGIRNGTDPYHVVLEYEDYEDHLLHKIPPMSRKDLEKRPLLVKGRARKVPIHTLCNRFLVHSSLSEKIYSCVRIMVELFRPHIASCTHPHHLYEDLSHRSSVDESLHHATEPLLHRIMDSEPATASKSVSPSRS